MSNSTEVPKAQFGGVVPHMTVADVARAAEHYREVLGFEVAGYWDGEKVHHDPGQLAVFAIVRRGPVSIHFNRDEQVDVAPRAARGGYDLYFNVIGLDNLVDELRGRGAEILEGPEERAYGQRELVVRDCNGFVLAFGEPVQTHAA